MPRINKTQFAILGCLSIKPMSAYDVKNFMMRSTNYFWMEYEAQLYPTLKKLNKAGYVDVREEKAQKNGVRALYHITDKGIQFLQKWLSQKTEQTNYRNEFLLKLFFSNQIDKKTSLEHLDEYKMEASTLLTQLEIIEKEIDASKKIKRLPYILATIRYGLYIAKAEMAWCDDTKKLLTKRG